MIIIFSLPPSPRKLYYSRQRNVFEMKKAENNGDLFHDVVARFNDGLWACYSGVQYSAYVNLLNRESFFPPRLHLGLLFISITIQAFGLIVQHRGGSPASDDNQAPMCHHRFSFYYLQDDAAAAFRLSISG
jgi:hypothetical protein